MAGTQKLVIVGGGGTCADVLEVIASINQVAPRYEVLGLLDDALPPDSQRNGVNVLGGLSTDIGDGDVRYVDCLGSPRSYRRREAILRRAGLADVPFETLIHPSAFVASSTHIGQGCVLFPNVVLLSGVRLGTHVSILSNSVLNHDVAVGDWSILASNVSVAGAVRIGKACYFGAGSTIIEQASIGDGSLVGMGSAVIRDVAENTVIAGVPARLLRSAE